MEGVVCRGVQGGGATGLLQREGRRSAV